MAPAASLKVLSLGRDVLCLPLHPRTLTIPPLSTNGWGGECKERRQCRSHSCLQLSSLCSHQEPALEANSDALAFPLGRQLLCSLPQQDLMAQLPAPSLLQQVTLSLCVSLRPDSPKLCAPGHRTHPSSSYWVELWWPPRVTSWGPPASRDVDFWSGTPSRRLTHSGAQLDE